MVLKISEFTYTSKLRWKSIIINIRRHNHTQLPTAQDFINENLWFSLTTTVHCITCTSTELFLTIFLQNTLRSHTVHDVSFGPLYFPLFSSNCPETTESRRGRKTLLLQSGRSTILEIGQRPQQPSGEQVEGSTYWQQAKALHLKSAQYSI